MTDQPQTTVNTLANAPAASIPATATAPGFKVKLATRWATFKAEAVYRLLRWTSLGVARLSLPTTLAMGRVLGQMAFKVVKRHRETVLAEMSRCFPGDHRSELEERLCRVFQHMGMNYMEVFRWIGGKADELANRIRPVGAENMEAARARGRGVLVLTAHTGNWDMMGLWAARNYPLTIISKNLRNPGVNRFWMEVRATAGLDIVPARKSYRACLSVMKKNGLLGFILDQNTLRKDGVFVDFFGKPACTTPGLAFLAAHAQAPVVPVFMFRQLDGSHRVHVLPLIEPPADRSEKAILEATQRYTRVIEEVVRKHPDQWIWMHRRWRTVPVPAEQTTGVSGQSEAEEET